MDNRIEQRWGRNVRRSCPRSSVGGPPILWASHHPPVFFSCSVTWPGNTGEREHNISNQQFSNQQFQQPPRHHPDTTAAVFTLAAFAASVFFFLRANFAFFFFFFNSFAASRSFRFCSFPYLFRSLFGAVFNLFSISFQSLAVFSVSFSISSQSLLHLFSISSSASFKSLFNTTVTPKFCKNVYHF